MHFWLNESRRIMSRPELDDNSDDGLRLSGILTHGISAASGGVDAAMTARRKAVAAPVQPAAPRLGAVPPPAPNESQSEQERRASAEPAGANAIELGDEQFSDFSDSDELDLAALTSRQYAGRVQRKARKGSSLGMIAALMLVMAGGIAMSIYVLGGSGQNAAKRMAMATQQVVAAPRPSVLVPPINASVPAIHVHLKVPKPAVQAPPGHKAHPASTPSRIEPSLNVKALRRDSQDEYMINNSDKSPPGSLFTDIPASH